MTHKGTKTKILLESLRATHTKYQIGKRQAMMAYMDNGFKYSHDRLGIEMNRC